MKQLRRNFRLLFVGADSIREECIREDLIDSIKSFILVTLFVMLFISLIVFLATAVHVIQHNSQFACKEGYIWVSSVKACLQGYKP